MSVVVFMIGFVIVAGVAVIAGMVFARERDRHRAARLDAQRWRLWRWEQALIAAADSDGCPSCHLLRARAELQNRHYDGSGSV